MRRAVLPLLLAAITAQGDEVTFRWGTKVQGIARREGDTVVIETISGTMKVAASDVVSIDTTKRSIVQDYYDKLEKIKTSQEPADFEALARWAQDNGMKRFVPELQRKADEARRKKILEEYKTKREAIKTTKDPMECVKLAVWAKENGLDGDVSGLVARAATICTGPETALALADYAVRYGLGGACEPLFETACTADGDPRVLVELAGRAGKLGFHALGDKLVARARALCDQRFGPRDVLTLAAIVKRVRSEVEVTAFVRRAAALCDGKTVMEILELVSFGKEQGLGGHLGPLYERVLALQPDNEVARRGLGFYLHQGRWLTHDEWQVAQGNVKFEGSWMSAAERDLKIKDRAARLEERLRDLERDRRALEDAQRKLERERDSLERRERDVEDRERRVKDREDELRRYTYCGTCRVYYSGEHTCLSSYSFCRSCRTYYSASHICSKEYDWCSSCGGYFRHPHRCGK